jgi:choline dehydrogenase
VTEQAIRTEDTFDYLIVGAGSAGCVLANRLSENPSHRVCLIEAGPRDWHPLIRIPLGVMRLMRHKVVNWRFNTEAQANADNRPIYIPRGRVIGGSSSINGMVYMRGHRLDYDDWASAGNEGWSYREVLPYFLRSENNEEFGETPYHHKGGLLTVSNCQNYTPLGELLFAAAQSLQLPLTSDFNGRDQEGFGRRQMTVKNGERESAATAFLNPARSRPNLTILTDCVVDKVTIENRRATGVELLTSSGKRRLATRKEVIVSAGSIASPTLLQRSGVGSGAELRKHGIDVILDLPGVGQNLQDHLISSVQHRTESRVPYGITFDKLPWVAWQVIQYALFRRGLLTNPMLHVAGFVRTDPALDRPNIQFLLLPANRSPGGTTGIGHGYGLSVMLLRPKSRGAVSIRSRDPSAPPIIDPHFLEDPADMKLLMQGVKLGRRILAAPAWDSVRGPETAPGVEVQTDDEICAYIRRICSTAFHPIGTCKMGKDEMAVVDPQLRVHGIAGLRVADASIMPTLIGGNTAAPTMMIGEKASDMILNKAPPPPSPGI